MAGIRKRERKRGTVYEAEICVNGRRASKSFERRWEAERWAEEATANMLAGLEPDGAPIDTISFQNAAARYEKSVTSVKRPNTRHREAVILTNLEKFFGKRLLTEIDGPIVADYRDARLRHVAPATVCRELDVLRHLFSVARLEWGFKVENPAAVVRRPKRPEGRLRLLTETEIRILLDCCRESCNAMLYPWVFLQLHTGMRPSEGAGLTWGQVDLAARMLELPVTKTSRRRVPVTRDAATLLQQIRPDHWQDSDFVFLPANASLNLLRRPNLYFRRSFDNAIRYAEIENFTMHDLRHTAASYLLMAGVDLRTLAEILGHRTMEMVRRYTHLLDDHKLAAIDRINNLGRLQSRSV